MIAWSVITENAQIPSDWPQDVKTAAYCYHCSAAARDLKSSSIPDCGCTQSLLSRDTPSSPSVATVATSHVYFLKFSWRSRWLCCCRARAGAICAQKQCTRNEIIIHLWEERGESFFEIDVAAARWQLLARFVECNNVSSELLLSNKHVCQVTHFLEEIFLPGWWKVISWGEFNSRLLNGELTFSLNHYWWEYFGIFCHFDPFGQIYKMILFISERFFFSFFSTWPVLKK